MVNVAAVEVPPASVTVTFAVPAVAIRFAVTDAVSSVALSYVVVSAELPQCAVAPETKFVPLTVSVNAAPPAVAELGLKLVTVGACTALMVNVAAPEVTPEDVTVTFAVPAVAMRFPGTDAVSWLALTNVVANAVLPHCTIAPEAKFVPFTVMVNAAPPAVAEDGESPVIVGAELGTPIKATSRMTSLLDVRDEEVACGVKRNARSPT
jgi:hypothetical protein